MTVELKWNRIGPEEAGLSQMAQRLQPGERTSHRLQITDETGEGWFKVRESIPSPQLSPPSAVTGTTECVAANQLRTSARTLAYPTRNPWFSGDVEDMPGNVISMVNTS